MNNIKKLYSQVLDKKALVTLVANEFGRPEASVRSNWFGTGNISDDLIQKRVIELLHNTLNSQANKTKRMIE